MNTFRKLREHYPLEIKNSVGYLEQKSDGVKEFLIYLYENLGFQYFVQMFADDLSLDGKQVDLKVNYLLKNYENNTTICVFVFVKEDETLLSVSDIFKNAALYESEIAEMYGVKFERDYQKQLIDESLQGHPMRKNFKEFAFTSNEKRSRYRDDFYWQTPQTVAREQSLDIGVVVENGRIQDSQIEWGFSHKGLEKKCEKEPILKVLSKVEREFFDNGITYSSLLSHCLEDVLNVKVSDRSAAIRMVFFELDRIKIHCETIQKLAYETKFTDVYTRLKIIIEKICELYKFYFRSDYPRQFSIVGGVRLDLPMGWMPLCLDLIDFIEAEFSFMAKMIDTSSLWKGRLDCGKVTSLQALEWGITGPNLRASGVNFDLRKRSPYYFYQDVDFDIPIGQMGSVFDRYMVRREEVLQSCRIINQVLDNMPSGDMIKDQAFNFISLKEKGKLEDEKSYIDFAKNGLVVPKSEAYKAFEGARGETSVYLRCDGGKSFSRVKFFSGSMNSFAALKEVFLEEDFFKLMTIYYSLDISMGEVER